MWLAAAAAAKEQGLHDCEKDSAGERLETQQKYIKKYSTCLGWADAALQLQFDACHYCTRHHKEIVYGGRLVCSECGLWYCELCLSRDGILFINGAFFNIAPVLATAAAAGTSPKDIIKNAEQVAWECMHCKNVCRQTGAQSCVVTRGASKRKTKKAKGEAGASSFLPTHPHRSRPPPLPPPSRMGWVVLGWARLVLGGRARNGARCADGVHLGLRRHPLRPPTRSARSPAAHHPPAQVPWTCSPR